MSNTLAFEIACSLIIQVALLVLVCVMMQHWLRNARWASRLWSFCFLSIIGIVIAGVLLPHRRLLAFPDVASRETIATIVAWQGLLAMMLLCIWGIGVVVSLGRKAFGCWQLTRFLNERCATVAGDPLGKRLQVEFESNTRLLSSTEIRGPFCWQLHRPTIVLPEELLREDDVTLRHVLLHEIEHLRTKHPMQHFLQGVCCTVFWFHPAVWIAARDAELTREYLCDEVAAVASGKFSAYLQTLAIVAERCCSASCASVPKGVLAFGNRQSTLIRRCNRLVQLAQNPHRSPRYRPWMAAACLTIAVVLIQQVWLPTNALASRRSAWSPWPTWTATALFNTLDVRVRDFEAFEDRVHLHEWLHEEN